MARSFEQNRAKLQGLAGLADLVADNNIQLSPDKPRRFAGKVDLDSLLRPWSEYERRDANPNYYGRDQGE